MITILKGTSVEVHWRIIRTENKITEDFTGAELRVFLAGPDNVYPLECGVEAVDGYNEIRFAVNAEGLSTGVYDLKAVWVKNKHSIPDVVNNQFMSVSRRGGVLAVTNDPSEVTPLPLDNTIKLMSYVESYGRDGMSAYELAAFRGVLPEGMSEVEWVNQENVRQQNEAERIAAEDARIEAEGEREAHERLREQCEAGRASAEAAREAAENERKQNEAQREANEAIRQESYKDKLPVSAVVQATGYGESAVMSQKAVTEKLSELGQQVIYDVSKNNDGATFASLSALLSSENLSTLIPIVVRCGGMSIRFVQSSDNKYVQYRLMADDWSTTEANWQGVDNMPVSGSVNLVQSGGVNSYTKEQVNTNETVSSFADKDIVTYYTVGERLLQNLFYVNAGDVVHLVTLNHTPYAIFLRVLDFNNVKVQEIHSYNPSQGIEMVVTNSGLLQVEEPSSNTIKNVIRVYIENKQYALDKSISNIETNKLNAENSINLFNPETVISGEYVGSNGTIYQESSWSLSDFIEIEPKQSYYRTGGNILAAWYDQNKQYIENTTANNVVTAPSVAKYIRVSCPNSGLNSYMICKGNSAIPFKKYGSYLPSSAMSDELVKELSSKLGLGYFELLLEHISNPFIKTQIKLLGDSITAGVGGTGFSATGETIAGGSTKANVLTATCWSNMLYHFMIDTYAKEWEINFENKKLEGVNASLVSSYNIGTQAKPNNTKAYFFYSPNTEISACKFNFYGTSFSIRHTVGASNGIFSVYVDNVLYQTIDTYASESNKVITEITGITEGIHNVEIKINGAKNASSIGTTVILIGFKIRKYITFHPWGIGGTTSSTPLTVDMLSQDDNFVFIEYGTNDRIVEVSIDSLYSNLIKLGESVKSIGATPIFMCAPPASESQETDGKYTYWFTMTEVQNIISKVAKYFNIPFIDNYKAFIDYADQHSVLFDTLLADGLHPNDSGYKVMYNNIMETLGIARQPYYREWSGEN